MQTSVRKVIDGRDFPSDSTCSLTIAGTEAEVLKPQLSTQYQVTDMLPARIFLAHVIRR